MRRIKLSPRELNQVMQLREAGASWLNIQHQTGVPRRSAKRAYEIWKSSQSREELKAARKDVAAEEFRKHLESLITLAGSLVNHLDTTVLPRETRSADKFLDDLLMRDIYEEFNPHVGFRPKPEKEQQRLIRQNRMRLRSLQDHTREKVRWQTLEEWLQAWDTCLEIKNQLRAEAQEIVANILNNQKPKIKDRIEKSNGGKDVVEDMAAGVGEAVWWGILAGEPEEGHNLVRTRPEGEGATLVLFNDQTTIVSIRLTDKDLAEEVASVCAWAAQNLCKGDLVQRPADFIHTMQARGSELEAMLDPLLLRPLILLTRCDLCPA